MKIKTIRPQYVDHLPDSLDEGVLYICEGFALAAHKCCCGCGEEVITPLSPAQWSIHRHGSTVSLMPSIGNWKYACRSHYWIQDNQVVDALPMSRQEVARVARRDRIAKDMYIDQLNSVGHQRPVPPSEPEHVLGAIQWLTGFVKWLKKIFFGD